MLRSGDYAPKVPTTKEISTFSERVADLYAEKTLELESVN
jgi:hypothetical protein